MIPTVSYIICAMPRSGTHFVGEVLANTGIVGKPNEYFICDHEGRLENERGNIANLYGKKTLDEFRDLVIELGSTPNGVFGITIMWSYFHMIAANYRQLPRYRELGDAALFDALFYEPKYIWLTRRDKVRQAVSLAKAVQTDVWHKPKGAQVEARQEPQFNFDSIEHFRSRLEQADASWQTYFQQNGIDVFHVVYEDFVERYEETTRDLLAFLGLPGEGVRVSRPTLQRQSNKTNELWADRYWAIKNQQAALRGPLRLLPSLRMRLFRLKAYWQASRHRQ